MSSARKDAMEAALRIAGGAALRPPTSAVPIGYVSVHGKCMAVSYHRIGSASPRADSTPPSTSLSLLQSSIVSPLTSLQPRCSSKYTVWTKAIANETPTVSFLLLKMDVTNPSSDLICDWHDPFSALVDSYVLLIASLSKDQDCIKAQPYRRHTLQRYSVFFSTTPSATSTHRPIHQPL